MSNPPTSDEADEADGIDEIDEIDDEIIVQVSDYLDGALAGPARAEVARKIAEDPSWKRAHAELTETRRFLSGLQKAHARPEFTTDVTSKIHARSAGRFFGRRTFGDRVPFGVLLIVALVGLVAIGYTLWSSSTGSLKVDHAAEPSPHPGSAAVLP